MVWKETPMSDRPKLSTWRLLREVYRYEGARIWWTSRNQLLGGGRPCESPVDEVERILHGLADGVVF